MPRLSRSFVLSTVLALLPAPALAQAPAQPSKAAEPPIQDNSFLIEEAYNQEAGVVQTIQTYTRVAGSGDWAYTLTQEWPVPNEKHQLSFTAQFLGLSDTGGFSRGFGDLQLNYRYQLVGSGQTAVAVAPRATLVIPSGSYKRALGSGGLGLQIGLPLSVVLSKSVVSHTNLGGTVLFSAKNTVGDTSNLWGASLGQSVVWLAHPRVNLLLETVLTSMQAFADGGGTERHLDVTLSPGARYAFNLPNDLQIVIGAAAPIGLGANHGQNSLFLYFSVELPFWHPAR